MSLEQIKEVMVLPVSMCDIPVYNDMYNIRNTDAGWKISIQGKVVEDGLFLLDRLYGYLKENDIPFKVGTKTRYDLLKEDSNRMQEQGHKAMTIYCPSDMDIKDLCEEVYTRTKDYQGWHDVKTPTSYEHYAGGLFFRNDRDENGEYIRAN